MPEASARKHDRHELTLADALVLAVLATVAIGLRGTAVALVWWAFLVAAATGSMRVAVLPRAILLRRPEADRLSRIHTGRPARLVRPHGSPDLDAGPHRAR
jgi:hypothetical protein